MNPFTIVKKIIEKLSPEMQKAISNALDVLQAEATKTKGPVDDIAIMFFRFTTGL